MNTDGTGFNTCKECHKTESLWNHTTTDHKEGEQLEDRNVGESSCSFGDGTDHRVQSLMFMMVMMIFLFMHPKWWAIRLTSAPVNAANDAVRLLYDTPVYGKRICGEVLPRDCITITACVTVITPARGALLWRSWSHDTMRKGQKDAPRLNGIPTIEWQAAHCILSNNKWRLQKSLVQLHYLTAMEMIIIQF